MQKNSEHFSMQEILRMANSPAGQALMQLLQEQDPQAVRSAQANAQAGDIQKATENLSRFLSDPKTRALLQQLQEAQNG